MRSMLQRNKLTVILLGVAQTILGVMVFLNPAGATVTLTQLVGWLLIFVGGGTLAMGLMRTATTMDYVAGGGELILGLLMVIRPGFFVTYLFALLGILVVITGVNDLMEAGGLRDESRGPGMIMGGLTIAVGVLMLLAPFFFADLIAIIAGIALIVSGVTEFFAGIRMP